MPRFEIQDENGQRFEVIAPDMETGARVFKARQKDSDAVDAAKSLGVGVAEGAIALPGLPGNIGQAMLAVSDFVARRLGIEPPSEEARRRASPEGRGGIDLLPTSADIQQAVEGVTGEFRQPQTTAGEFARTIGQFAPAALLPGSLAARAGQVVLPAVGSEAAGQLTEGTPFEVPARIGGAIAGAVLPGGLARAVTPLPTPAARTAAVDTLRREGVESVTAGQATGRRGLQAFEAQKGGSAAQRVLEDQAEEFTRSILSRVGSAERRATPQVVDDLFKEIGKEFDDLAASSEIVVDNFLKSNIQGIRDQYQAFTEVGRRVPFVDDVTKQILDLRTGRTLSGAKYQRLREQIDKAARAQRDNTAADALRSIKTVLDDGVENWLQTNRPSDLGRWQEARRRYRNMLVVERAAVGAGEQAAQGLITPQRLRLGIQRVEGIRGRARGRSEFDELQRAGEQILPPLPDSGTARNIRAGAVGVETVPAAIGGTIGALVAGAPGAGVGAIAGAATPGTLARLALTRPGRRFLGNQRVIGRQRGLPRAAVAAGLELNRPR